VSPSIHDQLARAAAWSEEHHEPGTFAQSAPTLRHLLAEHDRGALDLSALPEPRPGEGVRSGLLDRLRDVGIDVWEEQS